MRLSPYQQARAKYASAKHALEIAVTEEELSAAWKEAEDALDKLNAEKARVP